MPCRLKSCQKAFLKISLHQFLQSTISSLHSAFVEWSNKILVEVLRGFKPMTWIEKLHFYKL